MTQMQDQLKDWAIVGLVAYHGKAWWYDMLGGEMGRNHFDEGVPIDLITEKLAKLEPQIVQIGFKSKCEPDYRETSRTEIYIPEFDNLAYIGSDGYRIHRLAEVFGPVLAIVNGDVQIKSLVAANGGALVSIQLSSPKGYERCGMKYHPSLFVATDHSGKLGTLAKGACGLSVCDNTQAMVISESTANQFKVKHTKNSVTNQGALKATFVAEMGTLAESIGYRIEKLHSVSFTEKQFEAWLEAYFPYPRQSNGEGNTIDDGRAVTIAKNKRNEVRDMYRTDRRCAPWQDTALGVLQTINTYNTHHAPIRAATRLSRNVENFFSGKQDALDALALKQLQLVMA